MTNNKNSPRFSKEEKVKIVLDILRGEKTYNEIASQYEVNVTQLTRWKQIVVDNLPQLFEDKRLKVDRHKYLEQEQAIDELYKLVGQRDVEMSWLKKKLSIFNR